MLNLRKLFHLLQKQEKLMKAVYKGSAIVLTCINIITLVADVIIIVVTIPWNSLFLLYYYDILLQHVIKLMLLLLIVCLEVPAICFCTHKAHQESNLRCYKIAHAFALCQIIWFLHRFINDVIISVVFFVLAPAQTLAVITLLLFTVGSAIAFVAFIIYKGKTKKFCFICCAATNVIMICGLLLVITLLYIIFVNYGLKSTGIEGLVLSLVPPFIVPVLFYIVKQKYFKDSLFLG